MKAFSITDIGKKRSINQDYVFCEENAIGCLPNLFIVADGMGGHRAGDYASRFCVQMIAEHIRYSEIKTPIGVLEAAIQAANTALLKEAEQNLELEGMGTTLVAATLIGSILYVANVGDSRLYWITKGMIHQVTEDHSLVEVMIKNGEIERKDARFHPNKNIITRALGAKNQVLPDFFEITVNIGDFIVMCSDGLSNMIEDEEIREIIELRGEDLAASASELVNKANTYGGRDNIAIIIIKP